MDPWYFIFAAVGAYKHSTAICKYEGCKIYKTIHTSDWITKKADQNM